MENVRGFKVLVPNKAWGFLQDANKYQATAQQIYLTLLGELQADGIAFKDIRSYLLKEAKKAGLYQKNVWSDALGGYDYPSKSSLKASRPAWFVQFSNFTAWTSRNYTAYGKRIDHSVARAEKQAEKDAKKQTVVTRTTSKDGGISETRTDIVEGSVDMGAAIEKSLSVAQIQAIILGNLSVLAGVCEEKGAVAEFNALMVKLGAVEEVIEIEVEEAVEAN